MKGCCNRVGAKARRVSSLGSGLGNRLGTSAGGYIFNPPAMIWEKSSGVSGT
jgi:hypothetical protein